MNVSPINSTKPIPFMPPSERLEYLQRLQRSLENKIKRLQEELVQYHGRFEQIKQICVGSAGCEEDANKIERSFLQLIQANEQSLDSHSKHLQEVKCHILEMTKSSAGSL